jgi:hypothetical protein
MAGTAELKARFNETTIDIHASLPLKLEKQAYSARIA